MKFSAHKLLKSKEGFKPALTPTDEDIKHLKAVRKTIRTTLRAAFSSVSKALEKDLAGRWQVNTLGVSSGIVERIRQLPADQKNTLRGLQPKFASQGSFVYGTMNTPCHQPPQQMDLDDGVYLPIEVLREGPIVGKNLFFEIVDSALQQLARTYSWEFVGDKDTCARLIIRKDMHVDVPLYAIPREQYEALAYNRMNENLYSDAMEGKRYLESDDVYMAVRNREHWIKSDPSKIRRWFDGAASDHGDVLRRVCRYLKAWLDHNFKDGGPSSITLMACAVESFEDAGKRFTDDSEALLFCTERLHAQLLEGVPNPVDDTEPNLFPKSHMSEGDKTALYAQVEQLSKYVRSALLHAADKQMVVKYFSVCFGARLPNKPELVEPASVAMVMSKPAKPQPQSEVPNMQAG